MWGRDGSHSDHGEVGAPSVCRHGNECGTRRSDLGTGHMVVFDDELWASGLALGEMNKKREPMPTHGAKTEVNFSDSHAAIR